MVPANALDMLEAKFTVQAGSLYPLLNLIKPWWTLVRQGFLVNEKKDVNRFARIVSKKYL